MGFFIFTAALWTFFGPVTLEKADDICSAAGSPHITLECYEQALEPKTGVPMNQATYNSIVND